MFASGRIIDIIVGLTLLEWIVVAWYHRLTGRGIAGVKLAGNLLAGICLALAVRGALTGANWPVIGACLFGGLVAHLLDLRQRWGSRDDSR